VASVRRIALGYNNVYVVDGGDARVVIDAGPDYRRASEAIAEAIPQAPDEVIVTHGHLDHAGLGAWWEKRGVNLAIGAADAELVAGTNLSEFDALRDFVRGCGCPPEVAAEVLDGIEQRRSWNEKARRESAWTPTPDGRWPTALRYLPFRPSRWILSGDHDAEAGLRTLHCPGHTPGNLVALHATEGWLFSGDQLLPDITPTPGVHFADGPGGVIARIKTLPLFLHSLENLRGLHIERCFPGHGEPFDNVSEAIETNLSQAEVRSERVRIELREGGGVTLYQLAEKIYPRALRRRFWPIVSTVQGHLDVLEERGQARLDSGLWHST
jgi:glyoxylase-like metal-dependent hydrolase (beta-lactamase superfamily II)